MRIGDDLYEDVNITIDEHQAERLRAGYVCIQCYEPHETPFPEACSLCGFRMAAEQLAQFEKTFDGYQWLGPRTTTAENLEQLAEDSARARARKQGSILIPSWVKL